MATDMIFETGKPRNVAAVETDKHSRVPSADFLLLFHSVFEVLRERAESLTSVFGFCTLTEPKGDDKICWRGFREECATKCWAGLSCLVFPRNLSLSAPKRCSVSCGSISYKTRPNHSPVGLLGQMLHVHPYGMLKYVLMFHRLFT